MKRRIADWLILAIPAGLLLCMGLALRVAAQGTGGGGGTTPVTPNYVSKSGDTMTGALVVPSINATGAVNVGTLTVQQSAIVTNQSLPGDLNAANHYVTNAAGIKFNDGTTQATAASSYNGSEQLQLAGLAAFGSTDSQILRFVDALTNTLTTSASYSTNAANGSTITILASGYYSISWCMDGVYAQDQVYMAITVNDNALTTRASGLHPTNLCVKAKAGYLGSANGTLEPAFCSYAGPLASNDVVRFHGDATIGISANTNFNGAWFSRIR